MAKTAYERDKNSIKRYLTDKTDSIQIRVPKGKKEEYKAFAAKRGTSLNALICKLLDKEKSAISTMNNERIEDSYSFSILTLNVTIEVKTAENREDVKFCALCTNQETGLSIYQEPILKRNAVMNECNFLKKDFAEQYVTKMIKENVNVLPQALTEMEGKACQ